MILITGAFGKTGQAILEELDRARFSVRAMVRREEQAIAMQNRGTTDVVGGDLRNPRELAAAVNGVDTIYFICPNMQPDELSIAQLLLHLAKEAGVKRIVYHSVLHPQTQEMAHHWNKMHVEELLFKSGLAYTILQPAAYMQNVLAVWDDIVGQGVYNIPYATTTILGMVDLGDVAETAAKVLKEASHDGAIYELATDEWLTQDECAQIMGSVLGRSVQAKALNRTVWVRNARLSGVSDYAIDTLSKMFTYYERYGFVGNSTVLTTLLQRRPTTFADFIARRAETVA